MVAERLGRRLSPLAAGLLIGLATALPVVVVSQLLQARFGVTSTFVIGPPVVAAMNVATAILAVELTRRAHGSLLPAAVLLSAVSVAGYGLSWWGGSTAAQGDRAVTIYAWATIVFVTTVALLGRLWQRSPAGAPPPEPVTPGRYEVVVRDLGMPL